MAKGFDGEGPSPREVRVNAGVPLMGDLIVPENARGLVVFAHGSGSGRHSPRNRFVARELRRAGLGTLLIDLLSEDEQGIEQPSLESLAERLVLVTEWLAADVETRELPIGYFGGSTGAAVALMAAANLPEDVVAVVCRGGRPDLVSADVLRRVEAPTLFLVGSLDMDVLALNRRAEARLTVERSLDVIEGASHLFEEPGALEEVAERARDWFLQHVTPRSLAQRYVHGAADADQREDSVGHYHRPARGVLFRDRAHAGKLLAQELERYRGQNALVLGVPRGGVPVAFEVAQALDAELDVIVSRKLGAPGQEELAIGAVTADGTRFLNQEIIDILGVSDAYLKRVTAEQSAEARRREARFRRGLPRLAIAGRTVIVVDDGLATGATMRAVTRALRHERAKELVVAVPVGASSACAALRDECDLVVCPYEPEPFFAVGLHYERFGQTSDDEVIALLDRFHHVEAQPSEEQKPSHVS